MTQKFAAAEGTFQDAPEESRDFLRKFAFICTLGFDVYIKRLLIEKMVDEISEPSGEEKAEGKPKKHKEEAPKED